MLNIPVEAQIWHPRGSRRRRMGEEGGLSERDVLARRGRKREKENPTPYLIFTLKEGKQIQA